MKIVPHDLSIGFTTVSRNRPPVVGSPVAKLTGVWSPLGLTESGCARCVRLRLHHYSRRKARMVGERLTCGNILVPRFFDAGRWEMDRALWKFRFVVAGWRYRSPLVVGRHEKTGCSGYLPSEKAKRRLLWVADGIFGDRRWRRYSASGVCPAAWTAAAEVSE